MSYDLAVYGKNVAWNAALALLGEQGLVVRDEDIDELAAEVRSDSRNELVFTLTLPVDVQVDDLPADVRTAVLEVECVYELSVEGSAKGDIARASKYARRLAAGMGGVVVDRSAGTIWTPSGLRSARRPPRGTIDIVELTWYVDADRAHDFIGEVWLNTAREWLPEATPQRFGQFEPMRGDMSSSGDAGFLDALSLASPSLLFSAAPPLIAGALSGGSTQTGVRAHKLTAFRHEIDQPGWLAALRKFFVGVANDSNSLFASVEVIRGFEWSGKSLSTGMATESAAFLAPLGRWIGLPPYPTAWVWMGREYSEVLASHLTSAIPYPRGTLLQLSDSMTDRAALERELGASWFPQQFLARYAEPPQRGASLRLRPADSDPFH